MLDSLTLFSLLSLSLSLSVRACVCVCVYAQLAAETIGRVIAVRMSSRCCSRLEEQARAGPLDSGEQGAL